MESSESVIGTGRWQEGSYRENENVLKLDYGDGCILWSINYNSIKFLRCQLEEPRCPPGESWFEEGGDIQQSRAKPRAEELSLIISLGPSVRAQRLGSVTFPSAAPRPGTGVGRIHGLACNYPGSRPGRKEVSTA